MTGWDAARCLPGKSHDGPRKTDVCLAAGPGWALFLAIAYVARPSEDSMPELLQLAGVVAMSICGLLGSLGLRLSSGRGLCKADHGRAQGGDQQCYPNHHQMPATSVDEGLDVQGRGSKRPMACGRRGGRMVVVRMSGMGGVATARAWLHRRS